MPADEFGLSKHVREKLISVLQRHPAVVKAVVYGSRAMGNYRPGSDIDLCLFGLGLDATERSKIGLDLDDLLLPYTIDLSTFEHIENEALRDHISRVGRILFERAEGCQVPEPGRHRSPTGQTRLRELSFLRKFGDANLDVKNRAEA